MGWDVSSPKIPHPLILKSPDQPTDRPTNRRTDGSTDDGIQQTTNNKQHPKYRATPDFQSRGEFKIWSLAIV